MTIEWRNFSISAAAAAKLTTLRDSWNDAYPNDRVIPALFLRTWKKGIKRVGIGFRPKEDGPHECIAQVGDLEVGIDFTDAERAIYCRGTLTFDGTDFDLVPGQ